MLMSVVRGHRLKYVEVMEQTDKPIRNNERISTDETASEIRTRHGKKWCKHAKVRTEDILFWCYL
jgi:hypothetical protein